MSSGIEIVLLAPLLVPALLNSGVLSGIAASGTAAMGTVAGGGLTVTGSSVVTTGAFASGSAAGAGSAGTAAAGTAVASGAILVVGAAGAALMAAHNLQCTYESSLAEYHRRLLGEQVQAQAAQLAHAESASAALLRARKTKMQAAESADIAYLRAGVRKLQSRLGDDPDTDPQLPGGCAQLLEELQQLSPDLAALFAVYETLAARASEQAAKRREQLRKKMSAAPDEAALAALKEQLEAEIQALRDEVTLAPPDVLSDKVRDKLKQALAQVESLATTQPQMAEQGLQLLRGRVGRELSSGAARLAKQREVQEKQAAMVRELAGRISARSQATLAVLEDEELASSALAQTQLGGLRTGAMAHLEQLSALLREGSNDGLVRLEKLAREADALFETTEEQLQQLAQQIYLESQIADVFTQLGYRVSAVEEPGSGSSGMIATIDRGHGVEVKVDGAGNFSSELVAFAPTATELEPHTQEQVCTLMDNVFEALRARGCGVKEKKRRHYKKGQRSLRVVQANGRKRESSTTVATPMARRIN